MSANYKLGPKSRPHLWKHGLATYINHGCRCDVCKVAIRKYQRERYYRKQGRPIPTEEAP